MVKVWDTCNGTLVRQIGEQSDAVWHVHIDGKQIIVALSRKRNVVLEVSLTLLVVKGMVG